MTGKQSRQWHRVHLSEDFAVHRSRSNLKIVLTRPKKGNALDIPLLRHLTSVFKDAARDKSLFRILLTAQGNFFCVGMDLGAAGGVLGTDHQAKQEQWLAIQDLFDAIDRSPQVTIAMVNGPCFGAGIGLVFACDIRLAVSNATFNVSEAKLGLAPAVIVKWLIREWGLSRAREAILTARSVSSGELANAGIVHGVADDTAALEVLSDRYIDLLTSCGPKASTLSKRLLVTPLSEMNSEAKSVYDAEMAPSDEARHGVLSFQQKAPPDWELFYSQKKSKL